MLEIKREYGDRVAFEFFGAIPSFAKELDAKCIPYTDSYDEYRQKLNALEWDIGLAPMPDTPFHACKHYNKFVEYAAAGIMGVYSNVPPYTRLRLFPKCAVFCENRAEAWKNALSALVNDRKTIEEARKASNLFIHQAFAVSPSAQKIKREISFMQDAKTESMMGNTIFLFCLRSCNLLRRFIKSLKTNGFQGSMKKFMQRRKEK